MKKSEFQLLEKQQITSKYKEMKKAKIRRPEALKKLSEEYGYAPSTISDIIFKSTYRKIRKRKAS